MLLDLKLNLKCQNLKQNLEIPDCIVVNCEINKQAMLYGNIETCFIQY